MAESFAKTFYPTLFSKLEKQKQLAANKPLSHPNINYLLSMFFNNKPLYESIDAFYSDEYKQAVSSGKSGEDIEKISQFRAPTDQELNLLYCDIHAREDSVNYSGGNQTD